MPEAPTETMSMDSNPGAPTGIDAMMAQLDTAASTGVAITGKPAAPAPAPAAPAPAPAAPAPAPAAPAPAPAPEVKPDAKQAPEPDWSKAPQKWHKIYQDHKSRVGETIKSLESKIKALESKPFEQAGDAKKMEALEKQLAEVRDETTSYKQRLAAKDFTQTDTYRDNYVAPANLIYKRAVGVVEGMRVDDGRDGVRAGTKADFDRVRLSPPDIREEVAKQLFGEKYNSVLRYADQLDNIKDAADLAAERHAESHERDSIANEGKSKQMKEQYEGLRKEAMDRLKANEKYGKWFSEDPADPEASKLLRDGFEEIERVSAQLEKLPLDQQAAYGAQYLARAAATPRLILAVNRITAERDALIEELEKLRGVDPGANPKLGVAPAGDLSKPRGIEGAAAVFDQVPR